MSSPTIKTTNTTTANTRATQIIVNVNEQDLNNMIDTLSNIKLWLIIIVLIFVTAIMIKLVKACRMAYNMHNETVIRRHNRTTPQI